MGDSCLHGPRGSLDMPGQLATSREEEEEVEEGSLCANGNIRDSGIYVNVQMQINCPRLTPWLLAYWRLRVLNNQTHTHTHTHSLAPSIPRLVELPYGV